MEAFIRSKYERKQYLKKDGLPPNKPTIAASATKETKSTDKVKNFDLNTLAKLQNTGPLIYISLNHKSSYCVIFCLFIYLFIYLFIVISHATKLKK